MYIALLLLGLLVGLRFIVRAIGRDRMQGLTAGLVLFFGTLAFFALLSFWGEMLWFDAIGYGPRFWRQVAAQLTCAVFGGGATWLLLWLFSRTLVDDMPRWLRLIPVWLVASMSALLWASNWDLVLQALRAAPTGVEDPILGADVSFYLLRLPLYDLVHGHLLLLCVLALVSLAALSALRSQEGESPLRRIAVMLRWRSTKIALVATAVVLGFGRALDTYHLLYSNLGVVSGAGWTDIHVRLPAYIVGAVALPIGGLLLLSHRLRARLGRLTLRGPSPREELDSRGLLTGWVALISGWLLFLVVLPAAFQWLVVEPNEISFERQYFRNNIEATRKAFNLHLAEEREFSASGEFGEEQVNNNRDLLAEVRLWDWAALDAVYKQFQEIRLYYEFADVDVDRYHIGDRYRQVMVSAREMLTSNLPLQSQTFVNTRFKYTHGYGITMAPVSDFTPEGLPNLLIKDIPPQTEEPQLEVTRPELYYGELSDSVAYVNTREEEFDYPSGDTNALVRYSGGGGVEMSNLWRKFVFGWKFDGTRLLFSSYPRKESRVMFHRDITERVEQLAPFLKLDRDPYIALIDGRLVWILDGYTASDRYPYSSRFHSDEFIEVGDGNQLRTVSARSAESLDGANYVRNSVKAVIDAYEGSVDLYAMDEEDPILEVWRRIFPGLFKAAAEMPEQLRAHLRYPEDYLLAQGRMYARYHMLDPDVFYNQEDLWVRATEKYSGDVRPVGPYYVMWKPPEQESPEFVLMLPFSPKNRQVMIGWIAGMCDAENYGRFVAYKFPKERRVLGPQQVETKIDQDPFLSGQLTLWDQRGSTVIRGNVLAIPIDDTLLYVEPIYLRAETAAYPELRLVAVMHGDQLSYAETFSAALAGLLGDEPLGEPGEDRPAQSIRQKLLRAQQLFERYQSLQAEGEFAKAGATLEELGDLLKSLKDSGEAGSDL